MCIVNISNRHPVTRQKRSFAVNSCLWLVYACHGCSVTTIEGIGDRRIGYHSIQNALYHFNGSQCGFCSPGMVMNMYSLMEANGDQLRMEVIEKSFGGNICRCTGYRPILDAFKSFGADDVDVENANDACCSFRWAKHQHRPHLSIETATEENGSLMKFEAGSLTWLRPMKLQDLLNIVNGIKDVESYTLVAGNTAHGKKDLDFQRRIKNE